MKQLLIAISTIAACSAFAQEAAPAAPEAAPAVEQQAMTEDDIRDAKAEEEDDKPLFWGFGNLGFYSGYQLYGSLVNSEPTIQGYAEANINLGWDDLDFGYLGVGVWFNNDLTDKRRDLYGKALNEYDPNIHWGKTFWFDDEQKWGLTYRTSIIWFYYPHGRGHDYNSRGQNHFQFGRKTRTTMDWDHYFELTNPYITPFVNWVHEYHENKANLWEMGLKKTVGVCDKLSITPQMVWTYRSKRYNWCFPTAGWTELHGSGFASTKLGVDVNYQLTDHIGIFAKVYWCHIYDHSLRAAAEHGSGGDYSQYKDFAWGGVGLSFNF